MGVYSVYECLWVYRGVCGLGVYMGVADHLLRFVVRSACALLTLLIATSRSVASFPASLLLSTPTKGISALHIGQR